MRSRYLIPALVVATLIVLILFGRYVWPTPYRYEHVDGMFLRIERAAGKGSILDPDKGWVPIPDSAPRFKYGWKYVRDSTLITDSSRAQPAPLP